MTELEGEKQLCLIFFDKLYLLSAFRSSTSIPIVNFLYFLYSCVLYLYPHVHEFTYIHRFLSRFCMRENMTDFSFCNCVTFFNFIHSKFIHFPANFNFSLEHGIYRCVCIYYICIYIYNFIIHSPVDGQLSCPILCYCE